MMDTNVAIFKLFPGFSRELLLAILCNMPNLKALVFETYGAGNAPTEEWLLSDLKKSYKERITYCQCYTVFRGSGNYGSDMKRVKSLRNYKLSMVGDITTEAAIAKLMYLLGSGVSHKSFKTIFETSLRGEMT